MADLPRRYTSFLKRIRAFAREVPRLAAGNVAALHRARLASRRLREWVPLLELDGGTARTLDRRLRKVTKQLGKVRELDALMLLIESLPRNRRSPAAALRLVETDVRQAQTAAHERLAGGRLPNSLNRLVHKLKRAAKRLEPDDPAAQAGAGGFRKAWVWALDARVARRAADLRNAIDVAGALYVPERVHAVRIAVKKLRYALELWAEAKRLNTSGEVASLKKAQALLGDLHDLEILLAWVRRCTPEGFHSVSARQLGSLVRALEEDCRSLHARYMRQRDRLLAIADRMGGSRATIARVLGRATA